jgi:hypothetical protein
LLAPLPDDFLAYFDGGTPDEDDAFASGRAGPAG